MTVEKIIFLLTAGLILGSAMMVVTARKLLHAALWLVVTLFGVAVIYAILSAGFLTVVQVVVYIGAIAVLFIFAVMLTRRELRDTGSQQRRSWPVSAIVSLVLFAGLAFVLSAWKGFQGTASLIPPGTDTLALLGNALVSADAYVLPFEAASVLLLAALVGAVYVAAAKEREGQI
jgi:NADH-quinone oxidoreductase subunit J